MITAIDFIVRGHLGKAPFGDTDTMSKFEVFNNINQMRISFPMMMSSALKALLKGLLDREASTRFKWNDVKTSLFFRDMSWEDLFDRKIKAPWVPPIETEGSSR